MSTRLGINSFRYQVEQLWNALPEVRKITDFNTFKAIMVLSVGVSCVGKLVTSVTVLLVLKLFFYQYGLNVWFNILR